MRSMILRMKPEIELIRNGVGWTYNLITPQGTRSVDFKSGQIVDYVSLIGKPVKVSRRKVCACVCADGCVRASTGGAPVIKGENLSN